MKSQPNQVQSLSTSAVAPLITSDIQRLDFRRLAAGVSCAVSIGLCMRPPVVQPACVTAPPPSMSPLTHASRHLFLQPLVLSSVCQTDKRSLSSPFLPFEFPARAGFLYLRSKLLPVGRLLHTMTTFPDLLPIKCKIHVTLG